MEMSHGNSPRSYLKQRCFFSKMGNRKVKQILCSGWHQREEGGYGEGDKGGECGGNITYSCMKMEK
jgi:hypothetical protein